MPLEQQKRIQRSHHIKRLIDHHSVPCSLGSSLVGKSGLLALSEIRIGRMASRESAYTIDMRPRVRVWFARTRDFLYEPMHPRLEEIRLCALKRWTWINGGVDLPEADTLFYLHFMVGPQPVDDFQVLVS